MRSHSGRPAPGPATSIEVSVGECLHDKVVPIESSRGLHLCLYNKGWLQYVTHRFASKVLPTIEFA